MDLFHETDATVVSIDEPQTAAEGIVVRWTVLGTAYKQIIFEKDLPAACSVGMFKFPMSITPWQSLFISRDIALKGIVKWYPQNSFALHFLSCFNHSLFLS